ncbi:MAG: YaiI/YqxD family protein [Bacillota bacterium]
MKIIVDADACPKAVLQNCIDMGLKYNIEVWTVASFNHNIKSDHHIMVGSDSQEADIKITNLAEKGDIVVTQDWGLAAMLVGKQARCINPDGKEYRPEYIGFLLEERELKAKYRRSGGRTKGPKKRTDKNDIYFFIELEKMIKQG